MNETLTPERREHLERTFAVDACARLAASTQDYYRTHGHYVPPLAELLNETRAERDMLSHRADWIHPDYHLALTRELEQARAREAQLRELADSRAEQIAELVKAKAQAVEALAEIAGYDRRNEATACRCGHRMEMCHAVNAATWCGGHPAAAIAKHALGECPPVCVICIREGSPEGDA